MNRPQIEVRWVDPLLCSFWQIGYIVEGEFRPWASGASEEALKQVIASERHRSPEAEVSDHRHYPVDRE